MTEAKYYPLTGGMDVVSPAITIQPGRVVSGRNYESSARGYRRIDGWERFDGRAKPSKAEYTLITIEAGAFEPAAGDIVVGTSSGKTAKVIYTPSLYSGSYSSGTAEAAFPVMDNAGLLNGEEIRVGTSVVGIINSTPITSGAATSQEEKDWSMAAREELRERIGPVPGSGPVRGIWTYLGNVYAFRDNSDGTAGGMYRASTTGWHAIGFGGSISFDAGTTVFNVGAVITGSTSGAKATVRKVVLQDGDWTTDDAEGRLIVSNVSGTFQNNETITAPTTGSGVVNGVLSSIALPPGGRYDFDNHNFTATTGAYYMYGANGVGYAFEFDGTTLTPIITGEADDQPIRIEAHKDHLFLGYVNGRIIHSAIYNPLNYEIIQGALLAGIGDEITDMVPTATGELAFFGKNKVAVLYGTNAENWNLVTLTDESGSQPWTAQLIGAPLYLDNIGIRSLDATQAYGNFSLGSKTQLIQPHFTNKFNGNVYAAGSIRIRKKDAYRLYWSDGTGVSIYFGRKQPECMLFELGFAPSCTCSGEDIDGMEILFLGHENGYVVQMDSGVSADGIAIVANLRLPFNHVGSPTHDKRWHKAIIEVDASPQTKISVVYNCSYGDIELPQPPEQDFLLHGGGGFWNEALWNTFYWSSPVEGTAKVDLEGIGQNLSMVAISEEVYPLPHTLHGITLHFNYRRMAR